MIHFAKRAGKRHVWTRCGRKMKRKLSRRDVTYVWPQAVAMSKVASDERTCDVCVKSYNAAVVRVRNELERSMRPSFER